MHCFRKILFPVDFSSRCIDTSPFVAAIARKFESEVVLLHVFDNYRVLPYSARSAAVAYEAYEDLIWQRRAAELDSFGRYEFDSLKVTRVVETGDPADVITEYVEKHEQDLIVMPTHGHNKLRRLLLGSVTSKVLHDTRCPVWTSAHAETLPAAASHDVRTIVCAVDLYSSTVRLIQAASDVAGKYGAVVQLVHAIQAPEAKPGSDADTGFKRFLFEIATEQLATQQKEAGTNHQACFETGSVSAVVRQAVLNSAAQLVVIGRGRLRAFLGRLRTNVGAIIRDSPCPVLSV